MDSGFEKTWRQPAGKKKPKIKPKSKFYQDSHSPDVLVKIVEGSSSKSSIAKKKSTNKTKNPQNEHTDIEYFIYLN